MKRQRHYWLLAMLAAVLALGGCKLEGDSESWYDYSLHFNFGDGAQGWKLHKANYTALDSADYAFTLKHLQRHNYWGIDVGADNQEGDLFLYVHNSVKLAPNTSYQVNFQSRVGSVLYEDYAGGKPSQDAIKLKWAVLPKAPVHHIDEQGREMVDLDLSDQSDDLAVVGDVPLPTSKDNPLYPLYASSNRGLIATTDAEGVLHLVLGVHSKAVLHHGLFLDELTFFFKKR